MPGPSDSVEGNALSPRRVVPRSATQPLFDHRAYLQQYYGTIDEGNGALLRFYADVYDHLDQAVMLEFGGGPTIYSIITAARSARLIHFCDLNAASLAEVENWLTGQPTAFNWQPYVEFTLKCESGAHDVTLKDIEERESMIRQKVSMVSRCNIFADDPLLGQSFDEYSVVAQSFVLDDLVFNTDDWILLNRRLVQKLARGGLFVSVSMLNASYWTVGGTSIAANPLGAMDVVRMHRELGLETRALIVKELPDKIGYDGFIMACGRLP